MIGWLLTIAVVVFLVMMHDRSLRRPQGVAVAKPSSSPDPAGLLLRVTMSQIRRVDEVEAGSLGDYGIDATTYGGTAQIDVYSQDGFPPSDWTGVVLPAVGWFAQVFSESPRFGERLTFSAVTPGWNLEDQTVGGQAWTWDRASLPACVRSGFQDWWGGACWSMLMKRARVAYPPLS